MWIFFLICCFASGIDAKVSDAEYALMPPVFHFDDFNRCMLLGDKAIYCSAIIELSPINSKNNSVLWSIIEEASRPLKNFKHHKLRHGICTWQTCHKYVQKENSTEDSLRKSITDCYNDKFLEFGIKAQVTEMYIQRGGYKFKMNGYNIFLIACIVVIAVLVAWGTIYEGLARYLTIEEYNDRIKHSGFGKFISCFSLSKNWELLLSPFKVEDAAALQGIQGVRFFTIMSIINIHTLFFVIFPGVSNTRDIEEGYGSFESFLVQNNTYSCQGFLVISGWLLAYNFFITYSDKKMKLKYLVVSFINRFIRLIPCIVALILFATCAANFILPGPLNYRTITFVEDCQKNWWANLLYINNYYDSKHMCSPHMWYVATDLQLYLISLVILGLIWIFPKYTRGILGTSLTIAVVIPILVSYINDYDITQVYPEAVAGDILVESEIVVAMYMPAHTNMGAYIIGLIFGYIFYSTKGKRVFSKKMYIYLWYILVIFPPFIAIYSGLPFYSEGYEHNRILAALYAGVGRNAFAFSMALCIYGVSQGIGWIIKDVLFWQPFQVLGKLCYCTYLFHFYIIFNRTVEQRHPSYMHMPLIIWQTLGDAASSFLCALVACLCVEMPFQSLQKLYIPQSSGKRLPHDDSIKLPQKSSITLI